MTMKTSRDGALFIAELEGAVLCPYQDSVGVWTIGIGHTAGAGAPDPAEVEENITPEEAIALFIVDLGPYEDECNQAITIEVAQHEFDAAVSFHYNTGAIDSAFWVDSLNAGDRAAASEQIMNWVNPDELYARRKKEQNLFTYGNYDKPFVVTVWDDYPGATRAVTFEGEPQDECPACGRPIV